LKVKIVSDILSPQNKKSFEYSGYHVSRIVTGISGILKDALKVEGAGIFEDKLKWDVSDENEIYFYSETRAKNSMDSFSSIWIKVKIQGSQNKKSKMGNVKISISGFLETKFNVPNFLRPLLLMYTYLFYNNQRREYINVGKIYIDRIEDEIRSLFNLIERAKAVS